MQGKFMRVPLNQPSHQCLFRISLWVGRASSSWLRISSETGETGISSEPGETGRSFGFESSRCEKSWLPDFQTLNFSYCMHFLVSESYMAHIWWWYDVYNENKMCCPSWFSMLGFYCCQETSQGAGGTWGESASGKLASGATSRSASKASDAQCVRGWFIWLLLLQWNLRLWPQTRSLTRSIDD